jgi:hypothetical protein
LITELSGINSQVTTYCKSGRQHVVKVAHRDGEKVNRGFMSDGLENLDQNVSGETQVSNASNLKTQEEVDRIVKARVAREREKWEANAAASHQSHLPGGVTGMTAEDVKRAMRDEFSAIKQEAESKAQQAAAQSVAQKVIDSFNSKMSRGADKYPDFQEKTSKIPLGKFLPIVQLATEVDNTEDVMYELATNKGKMGNIMALYNSAPEVAMEAINELSQSIKANQTNVRVNKPLSQIKPTATAVDNGMPSVRSYMDQDWIRR